MGPQPLYRVLAGLVAARTSCALKGNKEWHSKHTARIVELVIKHMPSGSGFDVGTGLRLDASTEEKLVFYTSFHHMTSDGVYDGWTEHTVTVRPSLVHRFTLRVSGLDRNRIKDLIAEAFEYDLSKEVEA